MLWFILGVGVVGGVAAWQFPAFRKRIVAGAVVVGGGMAAFWDDIIAALF